MRPDTFEQAVAFAEISAEAFRRLPPDRQVHAQSPKEYLLWHRLGFKWHETAFGNYYQAPLAALEDLAERAKADPDARNLLREHLERKLRASAPLSGVESRAAADLLGDRWPKLRSKRGRKKSTNFERAFHIYLLARHLVDAFGLKLTRNDAARHRQSACDAVSEGFARWSMHEVTYGAVKMLFRDEEMRLSAEELWQLMQAKKESSSP